VTRSLWELVATCGCLLGGMLLLDSQVKRNTLPERQRWEKE